MNKAEELREHVFTKETERTAVENFIKKIWEVFPDNNTTKVESPRAAIMYGSMNPDEVIQVLESYFEAAEDPLIKQIEKEEENDENEEAQELKKSLKENMEVFSKQVIECRAKTIEDMTTVIDEHFDYIQEQITTTENNITDDE